MVAVESVAAYLEGKNPDAVGLFGEFQELVERCGPSEPAPSKTVVHFKRNRVFAGAFVNGRRLELIVDLLRETEHPLLVSAFHTTKRVVTHRLRVTSPEQLDESIRILVQEAYDEVGPGSRGR